MKPRALRVYGRARFNCAGCFLAVRVVRRTGAVAEGWSGPSWGSGAHALVLVPRYGLVALSLDRFSLPELRAATRDATTHPRARRAINRTRRARRALGER